MMEFAAVLFDMDGVILDSMSQHAKAWQEVLAGQGVRVPLSFILENEGALGVDVLRRFLEEHGAAQNLKPLGPERASAGMARLLDQQASLYLERHAGRVRPYPGVRRVLAGLKRARVPAALVTSSRRSLVERCLPGEIRQGFSLVISAEDVSRHKPHPDPYLAAAQGLAQDPRQCLVVENAPAGIAAAAAAGATCYALCTTLPPEQLAQAQAIFSDLERLAGHLGLLD
ncbi:MAG: HAD family phosphatase [Desulfarculus sp.]|nr:HAD family phosphatase [Desulfarculus sp.]